MVPWGAADIWDNLCQNWTGKRTRIFCSWFFLCRWRFKRFKVCDQTQSLVQTQSLPSWGICRHWHRGMGTTSQVPAQQHTDFRDAEHPRDVLPLQLWEWRWISGAETPQSPHTTVGEEGALGELRTCVSTSLNPTYFSQLHLSWISTCLILL